MFWPIARAFSYWEMLTFKILRMALKESGLLILMPKFFSLTENSASPQKLSQNN